jgi:hypothetical protein
MKKLFQKKADWPYNLWTIYWHTKLCICLCPYTIACIHVCVCVCVYVYIGSGMNVHWLKGKQCTHILKNRFDTCRLLGLPESKQYGILLYKILYWLQHKSIQYWLLSFDDLLLARPFPYLSFPRWAWRIKLSRGIQQYQSWHQVWIASCCC